jgi:hypothetical protein
MGETVAIMFYREEEKKHSVRFKQRIARFIDVNGDEAAEITKPVLGTIYVGREGSHLADAKRLRVTIEVVE